MQLADQIHTHFRLDETHKKALSRLGLTTVRDLLFYFPVRYSNISEIKTINSIIAGETVTLYGKLSKLKTKKSFRSKVPMAEGVLTDTTGSIQIMWFNQAYAAKMLHEGQMVALSAKVSKGKRGLYLSNPEWKDTNALPIDTHNSLFADGEGRSQFGFPVYKETKGITSKWLYHAIAKVFASGLLETLSEYIPDTLLEKYKLPKLKTALIWMHAPQNENHAAVARKRFAFEEIFFIQLKRYQERTEYEKNKSYQIYSEQKDIGEFMSRFPFKATEGQENAITTILDDMQKNKPMARLLEGDVGSGKTAVAAVAAYATIKNRPPQANGKVQTFGNLQVAYMAPTEILATQHFENFIQYFTHTGISIGLITGSGCRKFPSKVASAVGAPTWTTISRTQLSKWVANGEIPIVIGTHALIQKSVAFKDLALVIIDEQHRFGALQRARLAKKENFAPHYLSMTATPIPRTLALTIYGDLDLSLLDQMPLGRKPVITEIVTQQKRDIAYTAIKNELAAGRQLYVICARINDPDPDKENSLNLKSVESEAVRLKKEVFPHATIGVLHSKMTKEKKESVMRAFSEHELDILVATSVVEVGVNVPNATVIIIEGAERFGLSQLHQLRGRVIRGTHQAYCYLFADAKTQKTIDRLKALVTAKNGFELAELDLSLRGAGELAGTRQWGVTDLGMDAIKNLKMVEAARTEARLLIEQDAELKKHISLSQALTDKKLENLHFE